MNTIEKQKRENTIRQKMFVVKTIHFLLSMALFYGAWLLFRYSLKLDIKTTGYRYNYFVTIAFGILVLFFNNTYNSYLFGYARIRALILAQSLSHFFSTVLIYLGVSLGWNNWKNPLVFIVLIAVYIILNCSFSYWGNAFYFKLNPPKKTLLLYRNKRDRRRFGSISGKPMERLYRIEKEIQFDGTFDEIKGELDQGYDAVFVAGVNSHCRNGILKYCEENNVRGLFLPHVGDVIMQGAQHIQAFDSPVLMARRKILRPEYRMVKRAFDAVMATVGLIVLSPLFLITALTIKLYDHGPVFYKQVRLTRNAREFISCMSQLMRKRLIFARYGNKINQIGTKHNFKQLEFLPILFSDR